MPLRKLVTTAAMIAVALALALVIYRARQIYITESTAMHPKHGSIAISLESARVAGLREVHIRTASSGEDVSAWYLSPARGAVVIIAHGTEADRSSMLPEIKVLASAGIGVLAFDWPGYGLSEGNPAADGEAREALMSIISWVSRQEGVDPAQLGALGFSYGGYRLVQVAARDGRLRRIALLGVPPDGEALTYHFYRRWTPVAGWFALKVDSFLGGEPDSLKPRDLVAGIAPRPILFVVGEQDVTVPTEIAKELYQYANIPKELLVVAGAKHGGYALASPVEYGATLVRFFGGTPAGAPPAAQVVSRKRASFGPER
jgi:uncharacterized protein